MCSKLDIDDIVIGCKAGISRYQTMLYNEYRGRMLSLVKRHIEDIHIAEEIMHDGFVRIYAKVDQYEGLGSFEGWMRRVMYHAVCNAVKADDRISTQKKTGWGRRGSQVDASEFGMDHAVTKRGIYTTMVDRFGKDDLEILINRLPGATGKAFKLYLDGDKHAVIGKEMGISAGTSKWHVSTAKETLRKIIKR